MSVVLNSLMAVSLLCQAPKTSLLRSAIAGSYSISTGFERWTLILRPDGRLTYSWKPDHPGGSSSTGSWAVRGDQVVLIVRSSRNPAVSHHWQCVPVTWGERHYLVLVEEIRDFAGLAMQWQDEHRDLQSQLQEFHRAPLLRDLNKRPRRFGKPHAPGEFSAWFEF